MPIQTTFKRYELKYLLTQAQYDDLRLCMQKHMMSDQYGRYKISNIYFDTPDYKVIRECLDHPKYKEKLRLRLYGDFSADKTVFIELKRKCNGFVYKKRMNLPQAQALPYLCENQSLCEHSQILNEIEYFKHIHPDLLPRVYLFYEREAFFAVADKDFRMTFDFNMTMRDCDVSLEKSNYDRKILSENYIVLEVKTVIGLPFWFIDFLNQNKLYKTSFSKYATAYRRYILPTFTHTLRRLSHAQ
ncbi:MAG: polyphosphate polymerase domain-containing protein [Spirochaetales bacterium]